MIAETDLSLLDGNRILITGGTGSLGHCLTRMILKATTEATVIIYSRDELKQSLMRQEFDAYQSRLRFFLGDVRDESRIRRALQGVRFVIHAAALKQVPAAEYNPFEFVKTNILGAQNLINAAIDAGISRIVALSTDKAANPINLYGATKLCSDKLFVSGNSYSGEKGTRFSVVRYGNVVGSRGSVVPLFMEQRKTGVLTVTDRRMTRFWITLPQAGELVLGALAKMHGGEIWVPKIPSMRTIDLARLIGPECEIRESGIRPGEKLHETMISRDDARQCLEFETHYIITPSFPWWKAAWHSDEGSRPCPDGFCYRSDNNPRWAGPEEMREMISGLSFPENGSGVTG